ncbi:hypothetical protein BJ085DRAFT_33145 [Dimargaris cristalligena]|uniref:P-loop containing nucleoside triphosphate hydrolase protein n=1 Tax=Dimargaris cristalligena TaxID=215637 RepID=A0A4P9ZP59_9FUNG|nr:hypothetical protein BJ085DRAFT_33145 [Dimargaris cristalligena]|eukprot:RKP34995.1 hypothetical protein BJ085DRAFT_33145 [Dimargaris cristalligena]
MGNEQAKPMDPAAGFRERSVKPLDSSFRQGIHLNLKIIIRGDTITGKTTLYHHLQNLPPPPEYEPTSEIGISHIKWDRQEDQMRVKAEIWDVVDRSPARRKLSHHLKLTNSPAQDPSSASPTADQPPADVGLDAETVNVYSNTNCVLVLFDLSKRWTFEYALAELQRIPHHLTTLLIGNFLDRTEQRAVTPAEIRTALARITRQRIRQRDRRLREQKQYTLPTMEGSSTHPWLLSSAEIQDPADTIILRYCECALGAPPSKPKGPAAATVVGGASVLPRTSSSSRGPTTPTLNLASPITTASPSGGSSRDVTGLDYIWAFLKLPLLQQQTRDWYYRAQRGQRELATRLQEVSGPEAAEWEIDWARLLDTEDDDEEDIGDSHVEVAHVGSENSRSQSEDNHASGLHAPIQNPIPLKRGDMGPVIGADTSLGPTRRRPHSPGSKRLVADYPNVQVDTVVPDLSYDRSQYETISDQDDASDGVDESDSEHIFMENRAGWFMVVAKN